MPWRKYVGRHPRGAECVLHLHAITKLRSDANCWFLYTGPHPKRRGARRKYDGKVHFQDLSRFEDLGTRQEEPHLHL